MEDAITGLDWNGIIKKYFVELVDVVKSGVDFASKEVPLYLKELIAYEFWNSIVYMVLFFLIAIFAGYCSRYMRVKARELVNTVSDDDVFGAWVCSGVCAALCLIFVVQGVQEVDHAVKAAVAPRVIIVEKIQELIKDTAPKNCSK